jgi:hypothetical protein
MDDERLFVGALRLREPAEAVECVAEVVERVRDLNVRGSEDLAAHPHDVADDALGLLELPGAVQRAGRIAHCGLGARVAGPGRFRQSRQRITKHLDRS